MRPSSGAGVASITASKVKRRRRVGVGSGCRNAIMSGVVVIAIAAASGCGGSSGSDREAEEPAGLRKPDTCGEYKELSTEGIAAAFSEPRQVTIYDDNGVRKGPETEVYDYYCALPTAEENHSLSNGEMGGLGAAECGRYLPLGPAAKRAWAAEAKRDENFTIDGSAGYSAWSTESRLGYKTGLGLIVFPVQTGPDITHPSSEKELVPGTVCSCDPQTDAVVPFSLKANDQTGTTTAPDLYGSYQFASSATANSTTSASVESLFSNDPICGDAGETVNVHWSGGRTTASTTDS